MMRRELRNYGLRVIFSSLLVFPIVAAGQDLGSSSGLFRTSDPSTKSAAAAPRKNTPKPKSSAVKNDSAKKNTPRTPAKNTNKSSASAKSSAVKIEPAAPVVARVPQNEIIINVGQKTSGDFDELFEQAIDEGNSARDERNYRVAESAYRRALSLKPKDSRAIYGLGNLFSDQQRWEAAEQAYRQATELEPNSPEAHIALSFVLSQPAVGTNLTVRYLQAEKMARKAILLDQNNPVAHDQLGIALELRGIIEAETQNAYRRAIHLDPEFALAYAHLGRLLRRNGLAGESSAAYREAIRLATDGPTMILVADVMQSQQRFAESEQLLRRALRDDPKNPTALILLGRSLTTRGSYDEAEKVLKLSLEVSPTSLVSYTLLGSLYARQADRLKPEELIVKITKLAEAEKVLMRALQVVSPNEKRRLSQEFEFVGDGFMKIGKGLDAARLYRQAIALGGDKRLLMNKLNKAQKS
jgi:tetratricopeptide (TPR) repeat protein